MTMEFKVGDKVRICVSALEEAKRENPRANFSKVSKAVGFVGTIVTSGTNLKIVGVKFDGFCNGHNFTGYSPYEDKSGLYVRTRFLEHIKDNKANIQEKVIILINKNKKEVTCTYFDEDGKKHTAKAKCSPDDCFNSLVGSQIALMKLCKQMVRPLVVDKTCSLENMLLEKV